MNFLQELETIIKKTDVDFKEQDLLDLLKIEKRWPHRYFYFSKPGQIPSFPYHKHDYDVIVKQIYGEALWKVENKEFILKPKDTCIIPKNTYHQVLSKNENKLSLTINIQ